MFPFLSNIFVIVCQDANIEGNVAIVRDFASCGKGHYVHTVNFFLLILAYFIKDATLAFS